MIRPEESESLRNLGTEQVRPELAELDRLDVDDLIDVMCTDVRRVPEALLAAEPQIVKAVSHIVDRLERGGRLIYVGAGTAGRLGMLDAAEAGPTFNVREGQVVGVLAGGTNAFGIPVENAEDDYEGGVSAMRDLHITDTDCVVGISASGRTPYVLGALTEATATGSLTVGVSCNRDTPLSQHAQCPIEVVVGPELIAGSTRMNSGTAQKFVLNIISTATMVRLGKTYGNLMVDLRPTNEKLRDRAVRIVARITDSPYENARQTLEASDWRVKVACAMIIGSVDAHVAARRVSEHEGRLRPALESFRTDSHSSSTAVAHSWQRLGVGSILIDGELVPGDVAVKDGRIMALGLSSPGEGIAITGFVDAQLNGYAGIDLLSADVDEIIEMGRALDRDGVIAYQPTLITSDFERVKRATERLAAARRIDTAGARILGVHLEGPFLSSRRAGTHPVHYLRTPDHALLEALLGLDDVHMITIAPEVPGALSLIELSRDRGILVSLGHSAATAQEAQRGFDAGARAVTHLFNAMEPLSARSPGLAGAALSRNGITLQLICDGVHVSDEMLRMVFAAAAPRTVLVSDAIAAAACEIDEVQLGDVKVRIRNGEARREDGTLAGSIGRLRDSVTRLAAMGIPLVEVLNAAVTRPAVLTGSPDLANPKPGSLANLVVLNDALEISRRIVNGNDVESTH
ncbi:MAG: N-acetylmuramic acid 6-phosphate etherase [Acidimicrobiales bacterium]